MALSRNQNVILGGSITFLVIWLVASFIIFFISTRKTIEPKLKSEYTTMSFTLTFIGIFCMWLMWVSVYMHQMYPLIVPKLKGDYTKA